MNRIRSKIGGAADFYCNEWRECKNDELQCNNGEECNIYCGYTEACMNAQIHCANGQDCIIHFDGHMAGYNLTVFANSASKLSVYTSNTQTEQLAYAQINCPIDGECDIQCNANHFVCNNLNIDAEKSTSLDFECISTYDTCISMTLTCPDDGPCNIDGYPTKESYSISIDMYSQNGFDDLSITDSFESLGTMHCGVGFPSSCQLSRDNSQCATSASDKYCDTMPSKEPTSVPTTHPTSDPSSAPTVIPSSTPSSNPSTTPTINPTLSPTLHPSNQPSSTPTLSPSMYISDGTTKEPTVRPTLLIIDSAENNEENQMEGEVSLVTTKAGLIDDTYSDTSDRDNVYLIAIFIICTVGFVLLCAIIGFFYMKRHRVYDKNQTNVQKQIELNTNSSSKRMRTSRKRKRSLSKSPLGALTNTFHHVHTLNTDAMEPLDINGENDDDDASLMKDVFINETKGFGASNSIEIEDGDGTSKTLTISNVSDNFDDGSGEYEIFGDDETPIGDVPNTIQMSGEDKSFII